MITPDRKALFIAALSAYFDKSFNDEDAGQPMMVVAGSLFARKALVGCSSLNGRSCLIDIVELVRLFGRDEAYCALIEKGGQASKMTVKQLDLRVFNAWKKLSAAQ